MRACGQKFVKFCTLTHTLTHAAKLVVRITQWAKSVVGSNAMSRNAAFCQSLKKHYCSIPVYAAVEITEQSSAHR